MFIVFIFLGIYSGGTNRVAATRLVRSKNLPRRRPRLMRRRHHSDILDGKKKSRAKRNCIQWDHPYKV